MQSPYFDGMRLAAVCKRVRSQTRGDLTWARSTFPSGGIYTFVIATLVEVEKLLLVVALDEFQPEVMLILSNHIIHP